MLYIAKQNTIW